MSIRLFLATLASAATLAMPAAAQDFMPGDVGINLGMSALNQERINSADRLAGRNSFARSLAQPVATARPQVANFDSRYHARPAVTRRVVSDYLSWVRSAAGDQTMRQAQQDLTRYNFVSVWTNLVRSERLAPGDMADALAGYLLLNWAMANDRVQEDFADVTPAVRAQVRNVMAASPGFASLNDADRQGFAETLMINFVMQHAGMQHALRTGDARLQRRLGDAAQQRFVNEFGLNLRGLRLTPRGFVARG